MKTKLQMLLAAAGVLGSVAVANAQPAPPPAPPPPPADAPPGAAPGLAPPGAPPAAPPAAPPVAPPAAGQPDPNAPPVQPAPPVAPPPPPPAGTDVAPAALPSQPPPAPPPPVIQWGNTPVPNATADSADKKEEKKPSPYRLSWFTWNHSATTTLLGVGRSNIGSEGDQYNWDFTFAPGYYVLDKPEDQVRVFAELGWTTELTNSDTTTKLHETDFKDMQLGVGYSHILQNEEKGNVEKGEYKMIPSISLRAVLPTSKISAGGGKYLTTALGPSVRGYVRLLGNKSDWLSNIVMTGGVTWSHLFARSYQPTNEDFSDGRPRQTTQTAGQTAIEADNLGNRSFDMDRLTLTFGYFFPVWKDISIGQTYRLAHGFKHDFSNPCVQISTGCATPGRLDDRSINSVTTLFDTSITYWPSQVNYFHANLGYQNETGQIGEDGNRRTLFYSPEAQFYLDLVVHLDGLVDKGRELATKKNTTALDPKKHF